MENKLSGIFYVYTHTSIIDGKVFYVGKGSNKRAYSKQGRNANWKKVAESGFKVTIVKDNLNEECAFCIEKILIHSIGTEWLTNKTLGGEGTSGWVPSKEFRENLSRIRKGIAPHANARSEEAQNKRRALLIGRKHSESHKKNISTALKGKPRRGTSSYKFYHPNHGVVIRTISCLRSEFGLDRNVRCLVSGRIKSTKGWSLYENRNIIGFRRGDRHHSYDPTIFTFVNGEMKFTGNKYEFSLKHNIKVSYVNRLISGERKQSFGWSIAI